jgi:hypothetical protein
VELLPVKPTKVFCIGFHKTGTKSLATALRRLGYRVTGPNGTKDPDIASNVLGMAHGLVEKFDAFQDNPWPIIYREMDEAYPGSKFILTLREPESWIVSAVAYFGRRETPMRKWIYGVGAPEGNEETYTKRFVDHYDEVRYHFRSRPDDLLTVDFAKEDGWNEICRFLKKDVPDEPFPHMNKGIAAGTDSPSGDIAQNAKPA